MNKPSVFSFFSGCGILDLGFERSGYNVVFVNEFSSAFLSAYKYSRTKMGIVPPKYGYANTDVNVFLNERSDELTGYIDPPPFFRVFFPRWQRHHNDPDPTLSIFRTDSL